MRIKMPAVRIAQGESEVAYQPFNFKRFKLTDSDTGQTHQDILTCGVCQKPFALGDINKFIQHKVHACNKENYALEQNSQESPDNDDAGCGGLPLAVVNTRRPSISAPIKKGINATGRLTCSSPLQMDEEGCSTPKPRTPNSSISPTPIKDEMDDHHENCTDDDELKPRRIKQELDSTNSSPDLSKKNRAEVADAESNTTHSEPSYYICSTCKQRLHSAWRLVQHCQNSHGIKIYLESSSSTGSSPSATNCAAPTKNTNNHSSSSSCSRFSASSSSTNCSGNSSSGVGGGPIVSGASGSLGGASSGGIGPLAASSLPLASASLSSRLPLLPPTSTSLVDPRNPFGVGGLLRMPLSDPTRHHQFPGSLGGLHGGSAGASSPVFARPSSSHQDNHFRMEQIVSEQFRLNSHHSMGLAAAAAAVAASAAAGIPPPHSPYPPVERPPSNSIHTNGPRSLIPPPPSLSLPLEPQLDFYSQRLRQLAGTTSPGVANGPNSLSPRKLTPPFTSPGNSQPLPPSRSSSTDNSANDSLDLSSNAAKSDHASNDEKPADFSVQHQDKHCANSGSLCNDTELKYKCEFCGKRFKFQSNLVVHRRTHTREKPYKCTICDHACTQSSKLKRHMKIHKKSVRGNGLTGGEAGVTSTNGDGSTTSTPEQISNDGSDDERIDDDEEDVGEEEEEEIDDEEDDDEEEDEEEDMELDEEGDEDDDGDAPEDLTTKSTSSTPPNNAAEENSKSMQSPRPTPSQTPLDKTPSDKVSSSGSLVSELMDKFGLSSNQLYSEAYKQALQESSHNPHIRKKDDAMLEPVAPDNNNVNKLAPPILENGMKMKSSAAAAIKLKEDFAANLMASQPPLDILGASHGFFGTGMPFENLLDVATNKRMKLDMDGRHNPLLGRNLPPEADGIYPGLWLPGLAAAHQRDIFGRNDVPLDMYKPRSKSNSENHRHGNHHKSHNSSLAAAAAAAMNLRLPNQHLKKESRRNDTCEFCGKVFKNCSNLTVHRRSHTGEKPYKCELCSYACAQSSKLTRHMKTHGRMGKDVYRCRFCEMPFSVPSTLEKHMRKCVVSQNIKDNGPLMPSMLIKCEDDSSISSSKDNT